ncbi:SDR family NAD(P)-dependent oxidoreductase [Cypionkella sinensis]|uniref:SDR family NAD(P)-dependent oxidoreductase n=1 Tax=Cypionkella sinensis TaxID=1756043 RepID=A0ABV7J6S7_9RHOB
MMDRITTGFGFSTTAAQVLHGVDLHDKTIIVTGGASGIGVETARALASAGASVTIAARRPDAAEEVAAELRQATCNAAIDVRELDVADLASVRRFVTGWDRPLHALVNNAGIMALPELERTPDGREIQFATNYLGHFALTLGLHPWLRAAQGARVVSVSSTGSLWSPILWDDPDFRFTPYHPLVAYGQSKTACILMSAGIAAKWTGDGIMSNALNPGAIATNLQRHTGGLKTPERFRKTPQQGAATSVLLAASPLLDKVTGRYFDDCAEAETVDARRDQPIGTVARYALDQQNAERLWAMAKEMIGGAL